MKNAAITGAASGIGLDCAKDLLAKGWKVFALDSSHERLRDASAELTGFGDRFVPIACDVSQSSQVGPAFQLIRSTVEGGLDALIGCAGVFRKAALADMTERDFDSVFDTNCKGSWLAACAAVPLLERGARAGMPARIVFLGSIVAMRPRSGCGAYGASNGALAHLAKVLAVELAPRAILVNVVAPATVDTPMARRLSADARERIAPRPPLGRIAAPGDITAVIGFLLSNESNYMTGAVLPVDGGAGAADVVSGPAGPQT